jgi:hypothetical protein
MKEYRRRFGGHECSIQVHSENGASVARLFTVDHDGPSPILDEQGHPTALTATSPAWAYLKPVRFLSTRFGAEQD